MTTTIRPTSPVSTKTRSFEPGTTGWSAADLESPHIESVWAKGRFEIIEGVLAQMPPAYLYSSRALDRLTRIIGTHLALEGTADEFVHEVEIVIDASRVLRPDAMLVTADLEDAQIDAAKAAGRADADKTRILVPPKLIIESVSPGHEAHDTVLKKRWYAEFGVPNYWVLDAFARSIACYRLAGPAYAMDCEGHDLEEIQPTLFSPLVISLKQLWRPLQKR